MRANGLNAMLKRIRELAAAAEASRTAEAAG